MEETYDVVVCGTGLAESICSGLLSCHKKKVLHVDRNNYYGGEMASLNLTNLWAKFEPGKEPPKEFGSNREWNVDLIPKFVMASGKLVKMLLKTKVTNYLEWKKVDGTYVYQYQAAGLFSGAKYIHKVPSSEGEILKSNLMSLLEKNRCKNFFQFVAGWDDANKASHQGFDPARDTMAAVYEKFGLQPNTVDFVGHAVALYVNDGYLSRPCGETISKVKLYMQSIMRFGSSPFIYPVYGLGGLPEGFSRLCAIHGGTFMLSKPVEGFEFGEDGRVCGVKSEGEVAKCSMVVCDPSYVKDVLPHKVKVVGQVVRAICFLAAPLPSTGDSKSCQIIIPQKQLQRRSDVYVMMVSAEHQIAQPGKYVAIVSTSVETANPAQELADGMKLLGPVLQQFTYVSDVFEPTDDGTKDGIFVSSSADATSHFESLSTDVLRIWQNITGSPLDLTITEEEDE